MERNSSSSGTSTLPLLEENNRRKRGLMSPNVVECDAVGFNSAAEELPAEYQYYIPPGDPWKEDYRLSTFDKFPSCTPLKIWDLARAGFSYSGFKDRVRCFSCGVTVDNWVASDNVLSPTWHYAECDMVHGRDTRNEPRPVAGVLYDEFKHVIEWSQSVEVPRATAQLIASVIQSRLANATEEQENARDERELDLGDVASARGDDDQNDSGDGREEMPMQQRLRPRRLKE